MNTDYDQLRKDLDKVNDVFLRDMIITVMQSRDFGDIMIKQIIDIMKDDGYEFTANIEEQTLTITKDDKTHVLHNEH